MFILHFDFTCSWYVTSLDTFLLTVGMLFHHLQYNNLFWHLAIKNKIESIKHQNKTLKLETWTIQYLTYPTWTSKSKLDYLILYKCIRKMVKENQDNKTTSSKSLHQKKAKVEWLFNQLLEQKIPFIVKIRTHRVEQKLT